MQGYIKLHRKIQEHWLYQEKRTFSKYEAWIDMLMTANHKDNKVVLGNELIEVERGQFITSIRKLGERWKWSNTKVTKFLELLKKDGMVDYKKDTKKTVITIENYGVYHDSEKEKTTPKEHGKDAEKTREHTDKNDKECSKNDKEQIPYAEIIERLNKKADKNFKHQANGNRKVIKARWEDGQRLDDFFTVIDYCSNEWAGKTFGNGEPGDRYLQPSTLFNGKFDERLNWAKSKQQKSAPQPSGKTRAQIEHEQMLKENGLA